MATTLEQGTVGAGDSKGDAKAEEPMGSRQPRCAVRGLLLPGAMCASTLVGGKFCGHAGDCEHQIATCYEMVYSKA